MRKVAGQAAKWAYDNREELAATAVSVAADVVVTGGCGVVTGGVGSVGCVLAGGFVGGAVYGAMSCPHDAGQAECILNNGEVGLASAGLGVGAAKVVGKAVRGFAETRVGRAVVEQLDGTPAAGLVRRVLGYADDGAAGTVERQVVRAGSRDTATAVTAGVAKAQTSATKAAPAVGRSGGKLYINGSSSANNLTPRLKDLDGLSSFDSIDAAIPKGGKGQMLDASCLAAGGLCAVKTGSPGHYSIRPIEPDGLDAWLSTRANGTFADSPYTRYLQSVVQPVRNQ